MNIKLRRLRIQTYRDQLAACNQVRAALSTEIQYLALHDEGLSDHRLDHATKESESLRFMLDLLEQQEIEYQPRQKF
jgi:hypothetical protein